MNVHAAPTSPACQLAILVGRKQAHLLTIKFAEASDDNRTRGHIHSEGKRICSKNRAEVSPGKQCLYQNLQTRQQAGVMESEAPREQFGQGVDLLEAAIFFRQLLKPDTNFFFDEFLLFWRRKEMERGTHRCLLNNATSRQEVEAGQQISFA